MARGAKEEKKAELILGQVVSLLFITSLALMALCYIFKRPVLFLFGASEETYVFSDRGKDRINFPFSRTSTVEAGVDFG